LFLRDMALQKLSDKQLDDLPVASTFWTWASTLFVIGGTVWLLAFQLDVLLQTFFAPIASEDRLTTSIKVSWALYVFFLQIGFIPPLWIWGRTLRWTAPPFRYRYTKTGQGVVTSHTIPALLWLALVSFQIKFLEPGSYLYHRILGFPFLSGLFSIFIITAVFSEKLKISPLGRHVMFMETFLSLGLMLYFGAGAIFIIIGDQVSHRICMVALLIGSGGPGTFRVLRSIREFISGRLSQYDQYTFYDQLNEELDPVSLIPNLQAVHQANMKIGENAAHLTDFRNVESSYFCMAFIVTDIWLFLTYYLANQLNWMSIMFCSFPIIVVIFGILLRFIPPLLNFFPERDRKDFWWNFQFDYVAGRGYPLKNSVLIKAIKPQ